MLRYGKNHLHYIIVEHDDHRGQNPIDDDDDENFFISTVPSHSKLFFGRRRFGYFFFFFGFLRCVRCERVRVVLHGADISLRPRAGVWVLRLRGCGARVLRSYRPWAPRSRAAAFSLRPWRRFRSCCSPQQGCLQNEANGQDLS